MSQWPRRSDPSPPETRCRLPSDISQFRYFVFNYMHTGRVASSHYAHRTKSNDLFMNTPYHVTCEVFESSGGRLKVVGKAAVGIDNVDLAAATEFGCLVVNAPTTNIVAAAEHGIAHVRWPDFWVCRFTSGLLLVLDWVPAY